MILDAAQYGSAPVRELLIEAAKGRVGVDRRWLRAIVDRRQEAVPALIEFGLHPPEDARLELDEDIIALLRHLKAPEAVGFYVEMARRFIEEVPDDLVLALEDCGAAAVEPLLKLLAEVEPEDRLEAGFLLASLRVHDERVLNALLGMLEVDLHDGAMALGLYGDESARPALEAKLAANPGNRDLEFALNELGRSVGEDPKEPFDLWELYPETADPHWDVLPEDERAALLDSPDPAIRKSAADTFYHEEKEDATVKRILEHARTDPDPAVRGACWESLDIEFENDVILAAATERLRNPETPAAELGGVCVAFAFLALNDEAPKEFVPAILRLYDMPGGRAKALEAMWRSLDPEFAVYFPKHLEDSDVAVRKQAIRGIGYTMQRGELGRLRSYFEDADVREDALHAYAMTLPGEPTAAKMRSLLNRVDKDAGGLDEAEAEVVQMALDERMRLAGKSAVFFRDEDEE
ncbi:MAG: hypothetical protein MUC42_04525 [Bryobacter sp.]|nr:hypothetical protein [Bryobacter sp.]